MAVKFTCQKCKQTNQAPESEAGTIWQCVCGARMKVPAPIQDVALSLTSTISQPPPPLPDSLRMKQKRSLLGLIMAIALMWVGILMICGGILGVLSANAMDTTVSSGFGRVHNIGLMQQQNMRLYISLAVAFGGGMLAVATLIVHLMSRR